MRQMPSFRAGVGVEGEAAAPGPHRVDADCHPAARTPEFQHAIIVEQYIKCFGGDLAAGAVRQDDIDRLLHSSPLLSLHRHERLQPGYRWVFSGLREQPSNGYMQLGKLLCCIFYTPCKDQNISATCLAMTAAGSLLSIISTVGGGGPRSTRQRQGHTLPWPLSLRRTRLC